MLRQASLKDDEDIESAYDFDEIVYDKRDGWRTSAAKAHRCKR